METTGGYASTLKTQVRVIAEKGRKNSAVEQLVKTKLLPRVALVREHAVVVTPTEAKSPFAKREIVEFADLSLHGDDRPLFARIQRYVAKGYALDVIYLDLLQPAAQHLGDRWTEDSVDFATATLGLCQMHQVVRELSPAFHAEGRRRSEGCHALLTPAGHEQHSFGLAMVGEFLRREGWIVSSGPFATKSRLAAAVRSNCFTLVGFSLSCDSGLDALASQIRCVRQASLNRAVWVLVGGRVFVDRPELVARVGADAMACDARQAALISRRLAAIPAERWA
ncbi:MAG: cobalamin B12-binding domain-containing protein [Rhodospirillales bacterium]|nr:cobalamin B12-binding domain-containing protein [Rhodospirillales bacterium]